MAGLPPAPELPPPPTGQERRGTTWRFLAIGAVVAIVVSALIVVPRFVSTPAGNLVSQRSLCQRTDDLLTAAESVPDQPEDVSPVLSEQTPDVPGFGLILPLDAPSHTASDLAAGRTGDASEWVNQLTASGYEDGLERW
jgi:hypothetical protein